MRKDYFKGFKLFKIIQLAVLIIVAITFFLYIYLDARLRTGIYTNKSLLTICVFLWVFMIYSVVCIILDFYQLEGHITHDNNLNKAVYTDSLTGIPNRMGCDMIFDKYNNAIDISTMGCALIEISNLEEVNHEKGRLAGNALLVNFSRIIERVGAHYGFVGRNNGNEFLVVIENCDMDKMSNFIIELRNEIQLSNENDSRDKISIKETRVLNRDLYINDFSELVARLYEIARGR